MDTEFSANQFESAYPDGIEYHWWFLARSRIVADEINAFAGPRASVLEVGCGRGAVVKSLREMSIDCYGVELANVQPISAVKKYVRTGIEASELSSTERKRYDTMLLLDVIEHIPDPIAFLRNLAGAFPNLSRVIITVPAREELWSNYDEFYGHQTRYTLDELEKLSRRLGWRLAKEQYFFHSVYFPAWLLAKTRRDRKTVLKPPRGIGKLAHRLISYFMIADKYFFPKRMVGTSAIGCLKF